MEVPTNTDDKSIFHRQFCMFILWQAIEIVYESLNLNHGRIVVYLFLQQHPFVVVHGL